MSPRWASRGRPHRVVAAAVPPVARRSHVRPCRTGGGTESHPSQLLMPEPPRDGEAQDVELAPHRRVGWHRAWQWMCGDYWIDDAMRPGKDEDVLQAEGD